ncbi:hypothetical protein GCM10023192_69650 [Amycolatopsis samaneae]
MASAVRPGRVALDSAAELMPTAEGEAWPAPAIDRLGTAQSRDSPTPAVAARFPGGAVEVGWSLASVLGGGPRQYTWGAAVVDVRRSGIVRWWCYRLGAAIGGG